MKHPKPVGKPGSTPGGGEYKAPISYCMETSTGLVKYFEAPDLSEAIRLPRAHYSATVSVKLFEVLSNGTKRLVADFNRIELKPPRQYDFAIR